MRLTISLFKTCLMRLEAHFTTITGAEVIRDHSNDPAIWRTTNFAEAEIKMDGKRYMLGMPLSDEAHVHCLRKVTFMRRFISECLTSSDVLINEMSFLNRYGEVDRTDLLLHHIPDGDTLYEFAKYGSRSKMLEALDYMESEFRRLGIVHNNLTPHNVIVGEGYKLIAIRYHYIERENEERDCSEEFASLREWVSTVMTDNGADGEDAFDHEITKLGSTLFNGYKHVSNPFEDLICVADQRGYLYVNIDNKVIIDGRFKWAGDFHEGRAEVETETGMGLIDRNGEYIIPPIYKIVDYDVDCGLSRVRDGEHWALFNYVGEQILPFEERYIDDEDLELLSI